MMDFTFHIETFGKIAQSYKWCYPASYGDITSQNVSSINIKLC